MLGVLQVETGDEHADRMVNIWNAYQCMVTFNLSRSASFFESGIGRGMGFRDSNQDLLGFVHMVPARARERILDIAATQLPDRRRVSPVPAAHQARQQRRRQHFNDDPLWLVLARARPTSRRPATPASSTSRCPTTTSPARRRRSTSTCSAPSSTPSTGSGPHGLPLIGRADWNDCLNLNCFSETPGESFQTTANQEGGVAESVFIAGLFVLAAGEMAAIADRREDAARGSPLPSMRPQQMATAVDAHGWDGAWFRRAYDDFGSVIGSSAEREGQIFIEPQGICIMAGIGLEDGRAVAALRSVRERLATPHGIVLQQPAFTHYYLHLGEISSYPPGYKENAGIFCHTNPWIMIAETMRGQRRRALSTTTCASTPRRARRSARSTAASRTSTPR